MIRLRRDNQDTETTQKTSDETGAAKKTWSKAEVSSDTETKKTWGKLEASSDTETKTTSSYGVTSNMQSSLSASTAKSTTQFASRSAESAYKLSATGYSAPKATVELLA
jgi:hypothetical protein